jgi:hypothetical protein
MVLAGACLFVIFGACRVVGEPGQAAPQPSSGSNLSQIVRDVIAHEIDAQNHDTSQWCYHKLSQKNDKESSLSVCQARDVEIDRLAAVNGRALNEQERKAEDERIASLLNSPRRLKKQEREQHEDAKQARDLLKLIPDAFVFQKEALDGDVIKLRFTPNPKFHPAGHEAQVFHHMEGTLTLDLKQKRLAEINGRLTSEVKFGGGLLGHLDKGGTFVVKQQEVAPGYWELAMLDVRMEGKALFFKTIGVRQKETDSGFQRVPASATLQQVAEMTKDLGVKVEAQKNQR